MSAVDAIRQEVLMMRAPNLDRTIALGGLVLLSLAIVGVVVGLLRGLA